MLAGFIVDRLDYTWIFWLALVMIVAATVATHLFVPESPVKSPARIDWVGALGLGVALTCVLVAVSQGNAWGWTSGRVLGLIAIGLVLLAVWTRFELRTPHPLVDMRMMRLRGVWTTSVTTVLVGFGMFSAHLLLPQLVAVPTAAGFGFSASVTAAGIFMLPSAAVMLFAGPLAGALGGRYGARVPMLGGVAIALLSCAAVPDRRRHRHQHDHAHDRRRARRAGGRERGLRARAAQRAARGERVHRRLLALRAGARARLRLRAA